MLGGRRPNPEERPRWDRVRDFAQRAGQPVKGLFFLNATPGQLPAAFVQALPRPGLSTDPTTGSANEKVVDIGIQRTLEALGTVRGRTTGKPRRRLPPQMRRLLGDGRRVGVLGFREYVSTRLADLAADGMFVFDLEDDVRGFNEVLPRVRIIPLDEFDPLRYL